ncbi:AEC family transporter [Salinicoccus cyprini]|uniref:AEC family transporter n=1 Tax=Salinicoccus cyprini TaxID=2493691 RepID=A0A558ASP7_9STAP|nr:AEC family transporter [Salinicoccus cyprini]TVT27281.1 AEC family transporter [Salinicoccus cyprini]
MNEFIFIFTSIILPIGLIVGTGHVIQLKFKLDRSTLAKLSIHYVMPAFIFMSLYESSIDFSLLFGVMLFLILYALLSFILSRLIAKVMKLDKDRTVLFTNANLFYNAGNYGVPVNDLVFRSDPYAMSIQVMLVVFQNMFAFSYGIFSLSAKNVGQAKALLSYFKMPIFYGLLLGLIFNYFHLPMPAPFETALDYMRNAMIGLVLFILGAQIAGIRFSRLRWSAFVGALARLIIGPALAFAMLILFNMEGVVAQVILITSAMPAAVNSSIIAQEYSDDPEYAAEIVMMSTLLSSVTVSAIIYIALAVF